MGEEGSALFSETLQHALCCRICHENELESSTTLEAPCSCSGTAKFAHRECIQRWCNEKGDTTCEICCQNYEPGYTAPPRKPQARQEALTISIPDEEEEDEDALLDSEFSECSYQSTAWCKTVALLLTAFLLMRHLVAALSGEVGLYPFSLLTVVGLKSCGIIAPMYIIVLLITRIQNNIGVYRRRRHQRLHLVRHGRDQQRTLHITLDIQH